MPLKSIFANLSCTDLERSTEWFTTLFQRKPDTTPMEGLAEWHHGEQAGFQLYKNPKAAGHGTLTLIVSDIRAERSRLSASGMLPGKIEAADYTTICRIRDPDGNLVVLAQPNSMSNRSEP